MSKLLTEQELRLQLLKMSPFCDYECYVCVGDVKSFVDLIKSQKQAYAESVIGEDEDVETIPSTMSSDYVNYVHAQNRLRAEQKARLNR